MRDLRRRFHFRLHALGRRLHQARRQRFDHHDPLHPAMLRLEEQPPSAAQSIEHHIAADHERFGFAGRHLLRLKLGEQPALDELRRQRLRIQRRGRRRNERSELVGRNKSRGLQLLNERIDGRSGGCAHSPPSYPGEKRLESIRRDDQEFLTSPTPAGAEPNCRRRASRSLGYGFFAATGSRMRAMRKPVV